MVGIVTNSGKANITAGMLAYASRARHFQWGTGSGQGVAANDVASKATTTEARGVGVSDVQDTAVVGDTYRVIGTVTAAGTRSITEIGVFDSTGSGSPPAGGNMCMYGDFSQINLSAGDAISFTVSVQFS